MRHRGGNYEVHLREDGVLYCRVFRRPDLSREQGARCAQETSTLLAEAVQRPASEVRSLLFDMTDAPDVWGPATEQALGRMISPWESAGRRLVVVVGPEPLQRMNVESLIGHHAPTFGKVMNSLAEAERVLRK